MMTSEDPSQSKLTIASNIYADCRLVSVAGRVDHTNSDRFLNELSDQAGEVAKDGGMVIDLTQLEFITSAGLRALLLAQRTVTSAGGKLVVAGIDGVVKEVFRISKFDALLTVAPSPSDAVAQISPAASEAYPG